MDNEKAKWILSAYRPDGSDAGDPLFAEALEQARRDPELAAWLAEQRAFDLKMQAALQDIPIPKNLKDSLLVSGKITGFPSSRTSHKIYPWLAVAAGIVVLISLSTWWLLPHSALVSYAAMDERLRPLAEWHQHELVASMSDLQKIRDQLKRQGAPHDFVLPPGLASLPGLACEVVAMEGIKVTVLCFHLTDGGVAHLYVMNRDQLLNPPAHAQPAFQQKGAYVQAAWSDETRTYLLVERGNPKSIQRLL